MESAVRSQHRPTGRGRGVTKDKNKKEKQAVMMEEHLLKEQSPITIRNEGPLLLQPVQIIRPTESILPHQEHTVDSRDSQRVAHHMILKISRRTWCFGEALGIGQHQNGRHKGRAPWPSCSSGSTSVGLGRHRTTSAGTNASVNLEVKQFCVCIFWVKTTRTE